MTGDTATSAASGDLPLPAVTLKAGHHVPKAARSLCSQALMCGCAMHSSFKAIELA